MSAFPTALRVRIALAYLVVLWERIYHQIWVWMALTAVLLALVLLGVHPPLTGTWHLIFLLLLGSGWIAWLVSDLRRVRLLRVDEAKLRLEVSNDLKHNPLLALGDRPARLRGGDLTEVIWQHHRKLLAQRIRDLRLRLPYPHPPAGDRWSLHLAALLLLLVAAAGSWGEWQPRLSAAMIPQWPHESQEAILEAWIEPPRFIDLPPIQLTQSTSASYHLAQKVGHSSSEEHLPILEVVAGSRFAARVSNVTQPPILNHIQTVQDISQIHFQPGLQETSFIVERVLISGGELTIVLDGQVLGSWQLGVMPDQSPSIDFAQQPSPTPQIFLELEYQAADDHGLESISVHLALAGEDGAPPQDSRLDVTGPEVLAIPVGLGTAARYPREIQTRSFINLSAHSWAGLAVNIWLEARDGAGQLSTSRKRMVTLPARSFQHPVARRIIEQRRKLNAPELAKQVIRSLKDIAARPDDFDHDVAVYLALQAAGTRIRLLGWPEVTVGELGDGSTVPASGISFTSVQSLLWRTALRLEDEGDIALTGQEFLAAQQSLAEALERGADDAELSRLIQNLQAALENYLQSLQRALRQRAERATQQQSIAPEVFADLLEDTSVHDMRSMMDRLQSLLAAGAHDMALRMLQQMQGLTQGLDSSSLADDRAAQVMQAMYLLRELSSKQQDLLDRTFEQARDDQQATAGKAGAEQTELPSRDRMTGTGQQTSDAAAQGAADREAASQGDQPPGPGTNGLGMGSSPESDTSSTDEADEASEGGAAPAAGLAAEQGELGETLEGIMTSHIGLPSLRLAREAMGHSQNQLLARQFGESVKEQQKVIRYLNETFEDLSKRLMSYARRSGLIGRGSGIFPGAFGDLSLEEEQRSRRTRALLHELRRRASQTHRSERERRYLRQLLRHF